jgi:hypothetical protein
MQDRAAGQCDGPMASRVKEGNSNIPTMDGTYNMGRTSAALGSQES